MRFVFWSHFRPNPFFYTAADRANFTHADLNLGTEVPRGILEQERSFVELFLGINFNANLQSTADLLSILKGNVSFQPQNPLLSFFALTEAPQGPRGG